MPDTIGEPLFLDIHSCYAMRENIIKMVSPQSMNNLEIKEQSISLLYHFTGNVLEDKMTNIVFCVGIAGDRVWQL
jgi:hypothetical protein